MQKINGIYIPARDTHFGAQIVKNPIVEGKGTYQYPKVIAALETAKRRGHAIDVGGHVGLWSRILAMNFERVTAFEPVPEHIECFKENVLANHENVVLRQNAVGDVEAGIRIKQTSDDTGAACIDSAGEIFVDMRRLDNCDLGPVDFIKIDVEGYESKVVAGAEALIREHRPVIVVEQKRRAIRYGLDRFAAIDLLKSWGYRIQWEQIGDYCLVCD